MKRTVAALGALACIALAGCAEPGGVTSPAGFARPTVQALEDAWGPVTPENTVLLANLTLHNPNALPVPVDRVTYDVLADNQTLGSGQSLAPATLPPNGDATLRLATNLSNDAVLAWWTQHAVSGTPAVLRVQGTVGVGLRGIDLSFPFERERSWNGSLLRPLEGRGTCAQDPKLPCVASSHHAWATLDGEPAIASTLVVRNPLPFSLPLPRVELQLEMHGVRVGEGASHGTTLLPAGGAANVTVVTRLDRQAIKQWWPLHVQSCEESALRLTVLLDLPGGLQAGVAGLDAGTLRTGLECRG
jgi:LEA14-like dessication related protein